jgi:hypothetical protein
MFHRLALVGALALLSIIPGSQNPPGPINATALTASSYVQFGGLQQTGTITGAVCQDSLGDLIYNPTSNCFTPAQSLPPGTANYPLIGTGGSSSFQQLTGAGLAANTVGNGNLVNSSVVLQVCTTLSAINGSCTAWTNVTCTLGSTPCVIPVE